jgi:hypothetical protein
MPVGTWIGSARYPPTADGSEDGKAQTKENRAKDESQAEERENEAREIRRGPEFAKENAIAQIRTEARKPKIETEENAPRAAPHGSRYVMAGNPRIPPP